VVMMRSVVLLHKKKGAIFYEYLVRILIAIIVVIAACSIGQQFFRLSSEGRQAFGDLVGDLRGLRSGDFLPVDFVLDDGSALLGFTRLSQKIVYSQSKSRPGAFFDRPSLCLSNRSCLCLCRKGFGLPVSTSSVSSSQRLVCAEDGLVCESFADFDFLSEVSKASFFKEFHSGDYSFSGGFMYERGSASNLPRAESRSFSVYLQREGDLVGLCGYRSGCLR